uniref:Uncharacterized protein n=1 Tax=Romanomermis culicivorax TaxID=13658 RepID=A0A915JR66_ROMCU
MSLSSIGDRAAGQLRIACRAADEESMAVSTRAPRFSSVKDLGGASTEDAVTRGSKEHFFIGGISDLDLLFEFEGEDDEEDDEEEDDDVRRDFWPKLLLLC